METPVGMQEKSFQKEMYPTFWAAWDRKKMAQAERAHVEQ